MRHIAPAGCKWAITCCWSSLAADSPGRVPSFSGEESRLVFADRAVSRRNGLHRDAFRLQCIRIRLERFEFLFVCGLKLLLQLLVFPAEKLVGDLQLTDLLLEPLFCG